MVFPKGCGFTAAVESPQSAAVNPHRSGSGCGKPVRQIRSQIRIEGKTRSGFSEARSGSRGKPARQTRRPDVDFPMYVSGKLRCSKAGKPYGKSEARSGSRGKPARQIRRPDVDFPKAPCGKPARQIRRPDVDFPKAPCGKPVRQNRRPDAGLPMYASGELRWSKGVNPGADPQRRKIRRPRCGRSADTTRAPYNP